MQLPGDSIGITDLLGYRDCPRRMSYGMRRHIGVGKQSDEMTPEKDAYAEAYGSAIHTAIEAIESGETIVAAIQVAWNLHGRLLEPGDIQAMGADLDVYLSRDDKGVRTIASEDEFRVPLFRHRGKQIWFRFKVDRLYQRLDAPGQYVHRDYKSSRHPKSEKDVRDDLQLWAYNWALHEYFPEIDDLRQIYDQLKFGERETRKTAEARAQIKEWLIRSATTVIEDENWQPDNMLKPKKNDWCAWCAVLESCSVIPQLTEWARVEIAQLAPAVKEGRKTVLKLDSGATEKYLARFRDAKDAERILKRFTKSVSTMLKEMPGPKREALGYEIRERKASVFTSESLERAHELLGTRFYELTDLTKTSLETGLADEPVLLALILDLADEGVGSEVVVETKG